MKIDFESEGRIVLERKVGRSRTTFFINGERVGEHLFLGVLCDVQTSGVLDPRWKGGKWKKVSAQAFCDAKGNSIHRQEWAKE